jgi:hypothetical protein
MHYREGTKMQIQILLQSRWYYAYSIIEQLKEKKNAVHGDFHVNLQLTNQNLDAGMCH